MVTLDELSCQELIELVTEYLEGTLAPVAHARFEAHLAGCEGCRAYLEQMRLTVSLLGRLTHDKLSPAAKEELLTLFRDWKRA